MVNRLEPARLLALAVVEEFAAVIGVAMLPARSHSSVRHVQFADGVGGVLFGVRQP